MAPAGTKIPATSILGDGIGPEITDAVVGILDALDAPFEWDRHDGGLSAMERGRAARFSRLCGKTTSEPAISAVALPPRRSRRPSKTGCRVVEDKRT